MAENKKVDDKTIVVPKNYQDGLLEHPHMVVRNEAVVSCNLAMQDPQKRVGQKFTCPKCAEVFDVVQGDPE
jgi:acetone carboxylase gamma subunit